VKWIVRINLIDEVHRPSPRQPCFLAPCAAPIAVMRRKTCSWRWTLHAARGARARLKMSCFETNETGFCLICSGGNMKRIKQLLTFLLLPLAVGSTALPAVAGDKDPLFINLSTDVTERVDHALHFGGVHFSKGHPLTVFLNGRGVLIATGKHAEKYAVQQKSLAELMGKGAVVIVCQYCLKQFDIEASDLLPGYKLGNPQLTGEALFKDDTKTLSW
jgi:intracellular sulfur oxidation DsrE/DsrF family protein